MQAFERLSQILDSLAISPAGKTLSELVDSLDISKTALHRIATDLCGVGILVKDRAGRYHVGPRILAWADSYSADHGLIICTRDFLEDIHAECGETVHLFGYQSGEAYYIDKIDSIHPVRMLSRIGLSQPLYCTGGGKSILGTLPEDEREDYFAGHKLEGRTPQTVTDPERLAEELRQSAERGFYEEQGENEEDIRCVAVPVRNVHGYPIGAISIATPIYRSSDEQQRQWGELLKQIQYRIEQQLWHGGK